MIGLGAMGKGMARSLLKSPAVDEVSGYDLSSEIVSSFYNDAKAVGKATPTFPSELTLGMLYYILYALKNCTIVF